MNGKKGDWGPAEKDFAKFCAKYQLRAAKFPAAKAIRAVGIFARRWRPRGVVLLAGNVVYALTDPPLNRLRRLVPGLRLGGVGIDLSFLALYAAIIVIQYLLGALVRFA